MYLPKLNFSEQLHYLFEGYIPNVGSKYKELGYHSKLYDVVLKLLCEKDMSYKKATQAYGFLSDLLDDKRFKHTLGHSLVLSDICMYDAIWLKKILIVEYLKKVTAKIYFRAPKMKKLFIPSYDNAELKFNLDMSYLTETHQGCFSYNLNSFIHSIVCKDIFMSSSFNHINSINNLIASERSVYKSRYFWGSEKFTVDSIITVNSDIIPLDRVVPASYEFKLDTYEKTDGCVGELKRSFDGEHSRTLFDGYGPSKIYKILNDEALSKDGSFNLKIIM